ncbi:hypothetical protein ACH4S9_09130 [Streptomyces sp. NPDC021225]
MGLFVRLDSAQVVTALFEQAQRHVPAAASQCATGWNVYLLEVLEPFKLP